MRRVLAAVLLVGLAIPACSDDNQQSTDGDGAGPDGGIAGDGAAGDGAAPTKVIRCSGAVPDTPSSGTCSVTKGKGSALLLQGDVLAADVVYQNGQVLVSAGKISCVGCDCAKQSGGSDATRINCPKAVISPGLINPHDHLGWAAQWPASYKAVYDNRHEWRKGSNGKPRIRYHGNAADSEGRSWGELRNLLAGATSIMGSGATPKGILRNLDGKMTEGLTGDYASTPTFPLGDTSGGRTGDCNYRSKPSPTKVKGYSAWVPHLGEGIDAMTRNEFVCISGQRSDGVNVLGKNVALIHGMALTARDALLLGKAGGGVVWSPRSNISLYGYTARVRMLHAAGVSLSLGTDWTYSGSMNILRELHCAREYNEKYLDKAFSDRQLWLMATANAAAHSGFGSELGLLKKGYVADIAVFASGSYKHYAAVTHAGAADVALVLRGGEVLYGDAAAVTALGGKDCDSIDVCKAKRSVCVKSELGIDLAALKKKITDARKAKSYSPVDPYPLFYCGVPKDEPSCVPNRPNAFSGKQTSDDSDGDGVKNATDQCSKVFNPPWPMNGNKQTDTDGDKLGDACDPCLLDSSTTCTTPKADDRDGDGVANTKDNCPDHANKDQKDTDGDGKGDVCDGCVKEKGDTCSLTIKQLTDASLNKKPKKGTVVRIKGVVVTAVRTARTSSQGFYVREGKSAYEALFVFTGSKSPKDSKGTLLKPGHVITLEGTTDVFNSIDQLTTPKNIAITASNGDTAPVDLKTKALQPGSTSAKQYTSQLVRVQSAKIIGKVSGAASDMYWASDDGNACTGTKPPCTQVGDFFFDGGTKDGKPALTTGTTYKALIGVVNAYRLDHTLDVRTSADIQP